MNSFHFLVLALLGCTATACTITRTTSDVETPAPPVAPVRVVTDDYHGTKIPDPYRYFEDFDNPEVQAWVRGQAEHAQRTLHSIPGRAALLERVRELDTGAPFRTWVIRRWPNGDLHYKKRLASENLDKLYFRDAATGAEQLLIDPERIAPPPPDGGHYALSFCVPSPDRRYVAYGVAESGSEQDVLRVLDRTTGQDLPETIDRMEADYTHPSWLPDSSGFVYSRRQLLPPDAPATERYKRSRALLHRLGTDPETDAVVFSTDVPGSAAVPMTEADFPSIVLTDGSPWAIGKIKHGDTSELTLYVTPVSALGNPEARWRKICDVQDEVSDFAVRGDAVYLVSAAGAPRRRILRAALKDPTAAAPVVVVPQQDAVVIESISAAKDALYVELLDAGMNRVGRLPFEVDAALERLPLPEQMSSASPFGARPDTDGVFLYAESWTRGGRTYAYDPATKKLTDTGLSPPGKFDAPQGLESHEVLVTSHDGVKVPLSIVHRSALKLDGSNPTLVVGYGSYGISIGAGFDPTDLAWFERGGVMAVAHVRGGGELGKEWHHAGRMATKPNTWRDFIACCEYLIDKGYTSPKRLAAQGGSAGGILVGRAITERPDLFAAGIINVGCTDLLRAETTTNGVPNIQEFGSVVTRPGFKALLAMSPYHHIKDGTKYPAVLLTHGLNDPRVDAWMSAKMTARLQAATASKKPVFFRVDYQAGHGIGSTRAQRQEETADTWAFLMWQLDMAG